MRGLLFAALVVGLVLACSWARADERENAAKEEAKKLEGAWMPIEMEMAGVKLPEAATKGIELVISGDHYKVTTASEGKDEGTTRYYPDQTPKAIDITGTEGPNKGKTFLAIYELDGDKLKVCYDLAGKERPKEFKTKPNTQQFLAVYRKRKG
jgi:uncharacterized protein (TIGR03067 family)